MAPAEAEASFVDGNSATRAGGASQKTASGFGHVGGTGHPAPNGWRHQFRRRWWRRWLFWAGSNGLVEHQRRKWRRC